METGVYRELLEVMKARGGAYAGADIPEFFDMVKVLFTSEEAKVNNAMPRGPFTAKQMAEILERDPAEAHQILEEMTNKGLCTAFNQNGTIHYMSARFMIGIFEYQFMPGRITDRDREIARRIYAYKTAFDNMHPIKNDPAVPSIRVITVDSTVKSRDAVHTYDQVQTYIDANAPIAVTACYCRHAAVLRDEDIHGMPVETCMQFGPSAQFAIERLGARELTKEEARSVLDLSEEAGLIHMSQNMSDGIGFICNCDRWHCTPVKQALRSQKPALWMNSGFDPVFDPDACTACETCIERCPSEALQMGDQDAPEVDLDRCFGCAVCATGCDSEAISMVIKPDYKAPLQDGKALKEAIKHSAAN